MAGPATAPAPSTAAPHAEALALIQRHLDHLRVQRRLAERTLVIYEEALCRRLLPQCEAAKLALHEVRPHHVRGWTARLHAQGLGPRSIALTLSAWRGLYKWLCSE